MAQSVTQTVQCGGELLSAPPFHGPLQSWIFDCVSAADSSISFVPNGLMSGVIIGVDVIPGSGGSQPSDQFDFTLLDERGVDLLSGQGANLSNAAASSFCPSVPLKDGTNTATIPRVVNGKPTLVGANIGNAKSVKVVVHVKGP